MDNKKLEALIDKNEITEKILLWCRGVDRADEDLIASVYHDDSFENHGVGLACSGPEMAKALTAFSRTRPYVSHHVSNILIELHGDVAFSETYCLATTTPENPNVGINVMGARYLDRFERRAGEWKIAHRQLVIDWYFKVPGDCTIEPEIAAALMPRGGKMPHDVLYKLLQPQPQR